MARKDIAAAAADDDDDDDENSVPSNTAMDNGYEEAPAASLSSILACPSCNS